MNSQVACCLNSPGGAQALWFVNDIICSYNLFRIPGSCAYDTGVKVTWNAAASSRTSSNHTLAWWFFQQCQQTRQEGYRTRKTHS